MGKLRFASGTGLSKENPSHLSTLDGLRGMACLLVIHTHCIIFHLTTSSYHTGAMGISIFFVLSGFLLTIVSPSRKWSGKDFVAFYAHRLFRIYPALACATLLVTTLFYLAKRDVIALASSPPFDNRIVIPQLLLQKGWWYFWTIPVEIHFYLLFPWIFLFIQKYVLRAEKRLLMGLYALALLLTAALIWNAPLTNADQLRFMQMDASIYPYVWKFSPFFFIGIITGCIYKTHSIPAKRYGWVWNGVTCLACIFFLAALIPATNRFLGGHGLISAFWLWGGNTKDTILFGYTIGLIIFSFTMASPPWHYMTSNSFITFIGRISYSLYLFHIPVFLVLLPILDLPALGVIYIALLTSIAISYASYAWIERPCIAFGKKLARW